MTIRPMKAAALAILVIVALAALGVTAWGSSRGSGVAAEAAQIAEAQADRLSAALVEIEALEERTGDLEAELSEIEDSSGRAGSQLDRVSGRLWGSLDKLRRSVADAKSANSSAASDAASALANAGAALRDLAILENRFEYHLRQHGGG